MKRYIVVAKADLEADVHNWSEGLNYDVVEKDDYFTLASNEGAVNYYNSVKDTVLAAFSVMEKIPAIGFKAKGKDSRYLCDGPECGDWDDEYLDTKILTDALLVFRKDYTKPEEKDIQDFYELIRNLPLSNDVEFIKNNYDPIYLEVTQEELNIIRARNEW